MIAIIDSSIWNLTGVIEIWLVARRCQFASGVSQTLLQDHPLSILFTSRAPLYPSWKFATVLERGIFSKGIPYWCVFSRRHKKLHLIEKQHVRPERGASGRWRVCQPDVWKLRCWWRRRDVFTPKNVWGRDEIHRTILCGSLKYLFFA